MTDERPPCPVCHNPYRLEGAERYWEARWRDEYARAERLRLELEKIGWMDEFLNADGARWMMAIARDAVNSDKIDIDATSDTPKDARKQDQQVKAK